MKGLCIPVQCIRVSESPLFMVLTFSIYGNFFLISFYLISCVSFSFSPPHCCPLHFHFHLHSNISKMLTILPIHVLQLPVIIVCTASSNQTTLLDVQDGFINHLLVSRLNPIAPRSDKHVHCKFSL